MTLGRYQTTCVVGRQSSTDEVDAMRTVSITAGQKELDISIHYWTAYYNSIFDGTPVLPSSDESKDEEADNICQGGIECP